LPARSRDSVRKAAVAAGTGSAEDRTESAAEGTGAAKAPVAATVAPVPTVVAGGSAAAAVVVERSEETAESAVSAVRWADSRTVDRIAAECQTAGPRMDSIPMKFLTGAGWSVWQIRACFLVRDPLHLLDTFH